MHLCTISSTTKRLAGHARTFAHGAGTAFDKAIGMAHHYTKHLDPQTAGVIAEALTGHDRTAIARVVGGAKRSIGSYEELRKNMAGPRAV